MPHQCLRCNTIHDNSNSSVILKGCTKCGHKVFFFVREMPKTREEIELSQEKKELIMQELGSMINMKELDRPIILQLENIHILEPGKYEIDINQLMKKDKPIVYKVQEGTYLIDIDFVMR